MVSVPKPRVSDGLEMLEKGYFKGRLQSAPCFYCKGGQRPSENMRRIFAIQTA
ncbi:hypothetical protein LVJ83_01490 [Uruburuella testudinis]|uniref:Uncharacterized protein n=1 Tax=Uruburuella testudinis TaxID=1282863 RepID=A0ABY4DZP6_9NEIS|nr:hypothetical protein [Uruburuella testudinis]UOO82176.1 hypothetical protein LVJ83_01490 [Uruburuella testudinis]